MKGGVLGPEESFAREEEASRIREALASLSEEYREVILLKHLEGQSYREIARLLKTSVRSVESRLFRARQQLSRTLGRQNVTGFASREEDPRKQRQGPGAGLEAVDAPAERACPERTENPGTATSTQRTWTQRTSTQRPRQGDPESGDFESVTRRVGSGGGRDAADLM